MVFTGNLDVRRDKGDGFRLAMRVLDRSRPEDGKFVRLSEKTRELAFGRSGEFSYRHEEFDVAILLIFLNREMMQQG